MRNIKIVADSSSDVLSLEQVTFTSVPLKILTDDREFVDDRLLDVAEMIKYFDHYKGKSKSSCPNVNDYLEAFGDADEVYCITITGSLSGSYNAALAAKHLYEDENEGKRVLVIDSLSTGPEIRLLIEKLTELIAQEKSFAEICQIMQTYQKHTGLLFMLESMKNLANNGRVSHITAKLAGILGICVVGKASDKGELEPLNKCRGKLRAYDTIVSHLKNYGLRHGKVCIGHCANKDGAISLKNRIRAAFENVQIEICECRGLCSFYAEKGGLLIGFEKM